MTQASTILGIDPGLATIGFALLETSDSTCSILDFGVIETAATTPFHKRLSHINADLTALIKKYHPTLAYVEELFFGVNSKTALKVAHARGVVLSSLSRHGVVPHSITPNQLKLGITGDGNADKKQVQDMLKLQFSLTAIPKPDDAADALAIAYCGFLMERGIAA